MLEIEVITLFPAMVEAPLRESIPGRILASDLASVRVHDLRQWGMGRHRVVDDTSAVLDALAAGRDGGGELRLGEGQPRVGAGLEAVRRFVASVMDYEARVERLAADRRARLPHPELGPLCARGWLCLAALQLFIHRRQVERIVERLGERSRR